MAWWAIADHGDEWIRFEARSWCLTCELVVRIDEDCVSLATFVYYNRLAGQLLWMPVSTAHRRLVRGLLRHGASVLRRHDQQTAAMCEPMDHS